MRFTFKLFNANKCWVILQILSSEETSSYSDMLKRVGVLQKNVILLINERSKDGRGL